MGLPGTFSTCPQTHMGKASIDDTELGRGGPGNAATLVKHYVLPLLLVAGIGSLRLFAPVAITPEMSLLLLAVAVLLSARIGGMGPGLFGTILGAALEWKFWPSADALPVLMLFAVTGVVVSLLTVP